MWLVTLPDGVTQLHSLDGDRWDVSGHVDAIAEYNSVIPARTPHGGANVTSALATKRTEIQQRNVDITSS